MSTTDRRAFLETALAASALAALRPRTAAAAGPIRKAVLLVDAAEGARLPRALPARQGRRLRRHRDRDGLGPEGGRRDQGRLAEDRPPGPLGDERRALALAAVERRPGGGREERRRHGDLAAQREALGRERRAAGARGRQPGDRLPGRLDALAEGDPRAHPAARQRAQGDRRHRGGLEQVPALPARAQQVRGRVRLALGARVRRRRQHGLLRLPAGLDPHRGQAHRAPAPQGLQARPAERDVPVEEPGRGRHRLARGPQGARRRRLRGLGHRRARRAATPPT